MMTFVRLYGFVIHAMQRNNDAKFVKAEASLHPGQQQI